MNKKYIDFVPKQAKSKTVFRETPNATRMTARSKAAPEMKVPKDFADEMVKTGMAKTTLAGAKPVGAGAVKEAKAKKVMAKMPTFGVKTKKTEVSEKVLRETVKKAEKDPKTLNIPQARFVNTEKVTKRPLSKNVYQKKVVVPEEKPHGPVTIIQKPEKDSRIGMVVTILITIILGAAAGTVAFLLLPK
ncbi:hypothetical protein IJF85_00555 [Candidatus Saccharibacteria bacterium]|nr:hypothetical protein [Candidatus Saccharibacteria bacterium]MBQ3263668.1 hypothetical protein [Candidatus Saccharibacteria bacterium]